MSIQNSAELTPFSHKNSYGAEQIMDQLFAEPEIQLNAAEHAELIAFGDQLFEGPTGVPDLEEVNGTKIASTAHTYYLNYFQTHEGKADAIALGLANPKDIKQSRKTLFASATLPTDAEDKQRKEIAARSREWYDGIITGGLMVLPSVLLDPRTLPDPTLVKTNSDPNEILTKLEQLQSYRRYYRQVRADLSKLLDSDLKQAQTTMLDIHVGKVNFEFASLYPYAMDLADQLNNTPTSEQVTKWQDRLYASTPLLRMVYEKNKGDHEDFVTAMARRLDLVRNGAEFDQGMNISPISKDMLDIAAQLEAAPFINASSEKLVSDEAIEKLQNTMWNADQLKVFLEAMLVKWDLLSDSQIDWHAASKRKGAAQDDKWQVIISPSATSLNTLQSKKIMVIPLKFKRKLLQKEPAGVLPISAHELGHVVQTEYAQELAKHFKLAKLKGRRNLATEEMGAILEERRMFEFFGMERPTNTTYTRALQTKLAGGNRMATAQAFFATAVRGKKLTLSQVASKAKTAAKSTQRLYRHGGNNSQPLDYLGQEILLQSMHHLPMDQQRIIGMAGGCFDIEDTDALRRIGIFKLPKTLKYRPAEETLQLFMDDFYSKLAA